MFVGICRGITSDRIRNIHLVKVPGKKQNMPSSDDFLLRPTRGKIIISANGGKPGFFESGAENGFRPSVCGLGPPAERLE